jgi:hypothetical protein
MTIKKILVALCIFCVLTVALARNMNSVHHYMMAQTPQIISSENFKHTGLTKREEKEIIRYGVISGRAEACGLDWQRHFRALMAHERSRNRNEDQITFIAVLHGMASGESNKQPCGNHEKQRIQQTIDNNLRQFKK